MWTIRDMLSLMTVAACHLKGNNDLDNSVYKHSAAQLLNSVCNGWCAFPPYLITTVYYFSKKDKLLLLMVYCTVCLPGCGSYKFLSIWLLTNTIWVISTSDVVRICYAGDFLWNPPGIGSHVVLDLACVVGVLSWIWWEGWYEGIFDI